MLFKSRILIYVIIIVILITIGGHIILEWADFFESNSDRLRYYGYSLTFFSVLYAGYNASIASKSFDTNTKQFQENNNWNKKEKALSVSWSIKAELREKIDILDEHFNYIHRKNEEHAISIDDIHKKICVTDENGKIVTDANGKMMLDVKEGLPIRNAITGCLDIYEYLAAGIQQGIFDEEVILTLFKSSIIRVYKVFHKYIDHYNEMYQKSNKKIWENLVKLAEKLLEEESKQK